MFCVVSHPPFSEILVPDVQPTERLMSSVKRRGTRPLLTSESTVIVKILSWPPSAPLFAVVCVSVQLIALLQKSIIKGQAYGEKMIGERFFKLCILRIKRKCQE